MQTSTHRSRFPCDAGVPERRREWLALGAILAVALVLRLYGLGRVPPVVFHDECDNLVNVYQILNGRGPGFFGLDWKPQPAAGVYLQSLFVRLDMSVFALRLPTALFSVAALVPFYVLLRREVAAAPALLATTLLATDRWYLHFSRTGWENVWVCLFYLAAACSLGTAMRTGRLRSFVLAGAFAALGAYVYFSGRTILPTLLVVLGVAFWNRSAPRPRLAAGAVAMVLVAALLIAPQVGSAVRNWERFTERTRHVFLLGGRNAEKPAAWKVWIVARQLGRKLYYLVSNETSPGPPPRELLRRYLPVHEGALPRPTAALLLAGLAASLRRPRRAAWLWALLLVPLFLNEALSHDRGLHGGRALIIAPVVFLFVGIALDRLWRYAASRSRALECLVVLGVLALGGWSVWRYSVWARSEDLLEALEPAIPIAEFALWQEDQLRWTKEGRLINLETWEREFAPGSGRRGQEE